MARIRIPPIRPEPGPREFWLQLENHAWDLAPSGRDRMTGLSIEEVPGGQAPRSVTLKSPVTGVTREQLMWKPLEEALVFRRYTKDWAAPDDRKVNPWDLNERDPTDAGTMGTIPGAVLHLLVGDGPIVVHFRNLDMRTDASGVLLPIPERTHSVHPHGVVFAADSDGGYPLSPPSADPQNTISAGEAAMWASVGVSGPRKLGDRVPPGGTFTYAWSTNSWPTTGGVWLYHDHSILGDRSTLLGAIGLIVVHNKRIDAPDPLDFVDQDLPGGSPNGSPLEPRLVPLEHELPITPSDLAWLSGSKAPASHGRMRTKGETSKMSEPARMLQIGEVAFQLNESKTAVVAAPRFRKPPQQALYLQLYHELGQAGMCINGRQFLGNTPTLVAGPDTLMRFGLAAMNESAFHTFHIHGHRWVILGPGGADPGALLKNPLLATVFPQVAPVSQYEDTRVLGPATSFVFVIHEGPDRFLSAFPPLGEWHMHCHVPMHMMGGMMGSLLVVEAGQLAMPLPAGSAAPMPMGGGMAMVHVSHPSFDPQMLSVTAGTTVLWVNEDSFAHTATSDSGAFDVAVPANGDGSHLFSATGVFPYHCEIHPEMTGTIMVM